jgi:Mce-associated membrane protein
MNEDETPSTAAEMRALAEEAEAEAAEAEALAAAARARARALQLRRKAELVESQEEAKEEASASKAAQEPDVPEEAPDDVKATAEEKSDEDAPQSAETGESQDEVTEEAEAEGDAIGEGDADESADEVEAPVVTQGRRRWLRRPKLSTVATVVVGLIIVASLLGSGYMIKAHHEAVHRRQLVGEFSAAARQGVVTLTSLDFNNAKEGVQRILENSTGSFKDDFVKMADDFSKVVEQSKVISQGSVQAAAVDLDSMTDNSAVVLVSCTSEVTNAAGAKQDPRKYRLIVTVSRDGAQLKLSKVEFVP